MSLLLLFNGTAAEELLEGFASPTISGAPLRGIAGLTTGNIQDLGCSFTNYGGALVDPSVVMLRLLDPSGQLSVLTWPALVARVSVGVFASDLVPPYGAGTWFARWSASGTLVADTGDIEFEILPSRFG